MALSAGGDVDCVLDSAHGAWCWDGPVPSGYVLPLTRLPVESVVRVVTDGGYVCTLNTASDVTCFDVSMGRLEHPVTVHFG
jgi:hypothetical protein